MVIQGIKIDNRLTAGTIRLASYRNVWDVAMVDISVGILPKNSSTLTRRVITVPASRLLNGNRENVRTARYSHLMNIISSYALELWNVDFNLESVIFLGFNIQHNTTPQGRTVRSAWS